MLKTGACYQRPYNSFFNRHNNKDNSPVFAFRHSFVAQLKAEVNGKNCTPLRFVAFALCARLLLKTLIIPKVGLAIEFGSFFIHATILSFFVDFGDCDFNSHLRLLFSVLSVKYRQSKTCYFKKKSLSECLRKGRDL